MNRKQIEALTKIEQQIKAEITKTVGADVEITIRKGLMVYTENIDEVENIKAVINQVAEFEKESFYEADEDLPAGVTLFYKY